jgi:hypothetical protein
MNVLWKGSKWVGSILNSVNQSLIDDRWWLIDGR